MNIGDYVRTEKGEIYHIEHNEILKFLLKSNYHKIIKSSPNIIDLIEVGDYVNGYKVSFIDKDVDTFVQCDYPVQEGSTNHYRFYSKGIYSILTKEQFESMEYKIGDKE